MRDVKIETEHFLGNQDDHPEAVGWFQTLLDKLPDGVAVLVDGQIVYNNRSLSDLLHYENNEIRGKHIGELFPPDQRAEADDLIAEVADGGAEFSIRLPILTREGIEIKIELYTRQIVYGKISAGLMCVFRDLTVENRVEEALGEVEERFRTLVENAPEAIVVYDANTGRFVDANEKAVWLFGLEQEAILKVGFVELSPKFQSDGSQTIEFLQEKIQAALDGEVVEFEWICLSSGGEEIACEVRLVQLPATGRALIRGSLTDITGRKLAELALQESEERYALATRGVNDGLWDFNILSGEVYFSTRWAEMLGYEDSEISNSMDEWFKRVHPKDIERLQRAMERHMQNEIPHFEAEYRLQHKDGDYLWIHSRGLAVRDSEGNPTRMAGSQSDITLRKKAEEQLVRDALFDNLTGLPNRLQFMDRLDASVTRATKDHNFLFAVLFLDIDRFKKVNDSLGHNAGDQLLIEIGSRLKTYLQPNDLVARIAGDEFTILLDDMENEEYPREVAEKILDAFEAPFIIKKQELYISTSIGITLSTIGYNNPENLLHDSDTAMYQAKQHGKARYVLFDPKVHARAVDILQLEMELRNALEREEFDLVYVPIMQVKNQSIAGVEAFVRWLHPERGVLRPEEFLKYAEEFGMMGAIDDWVLSAGIAQMREWERAGLSPGRLAVNLSAHQVGSRNLSAKVEKVLEVMGFPPDKLELELLETVLLDDVENAVSTILNLKELGVILSLDDFGAVYSSLSHLKRLPVDKLRIDRSLIEGISQDKDSEAIVSAIISLAQSMNLQVLAEGVETNEQLEFLKKNNCDEAQGYLFGKLMTADHIADLLTN
ncbi:MAG: EAL domain-containing protein [Chloroflexi bacterium]|nr:EAL domain-containing protein [Chloroflexota bacterium]